MNKISVLADKYKNGFRLHAVELVVDGKLVNTTRLNQEVLWGDKVNLTVDMAITVEGLD